MIKKYIKYLLYFLATLLIIFVIGISYLTYKSEQNLKQKEKDEKALQAICDTIKYIKTPPPIYLEGFNAHEIDTLYFEIIREGFPIKNTIHAQIDIYENTEDMKRAFTSIPFDSFKKSDTIVVRTKSNLTFYISDFTYEAYLFHGMFGYLEEIGGECRLKESYTVNGQKQTPTLFKSKGIAIKP